MGYFNVLLKEPVDKDLRKIDPAQIPRIVEAIKELPEPVSQQLTEAQRY